MWLNDTRTHNRQCPSSFRRTTTDAQQRPPRRQGRGADAARASGDDPPCRMGALSLDPIINSTDKIWNTGVILVLDYNTD